jgi:hypothetical protein
MPTAVFFRSIFGGNMRHGSFQQVVEANSRYEYDVPNSAAAVCCCWILVLQIPERSPKMAVCKRFASPGPLNSARAGYVDCGIEFV